MRPVYGREAFDTYGIPYDWHHRAHGIPKNIRCDCGEIVRSDYKTHTWTCEKCSKKYTMSYGQVVLDPTDTCPKCGSQLVMWHAKEGMGTSSDVLGIPNVNTHNKCADTKYNLPYFAGKRARMRWSCSKGCWLSVEFGVPVIGEFCIFGRTRILRECRNTVHEI